MQKKLVFFVFLVSWVAVALPKNYQIKSAVAKRDILWAKIQKSRWETLPPLTGEGWSSLLSNFKAIAKLGLTFSHVSDELPEGRVKIIHPYGAVAKASFIAMPGHQYTGIFATGAVALVRFSLAADPKDKGFKPGIAIKFFVDRYPSQNIMLMHDFEGQGGNHNFFAKSLTNILAPPKSRMMKVAAWVFSLVKDPPTELRVEHLATIKNDGLLEDAPRFPQKIEFIPHPEVEEAIPAVSRQDFRLDLASLDEGYKLYDVHAVTGGGSEMLGYLKLDSQPIASEYGDKRLFFQHHR